jgi:hypothetical protein
MTGKLFGPHCNVPGSIFLFIMGVLFLSSGCGGNERSAGEDSMPQAEQTQSTARASSGEIDPCALVTGTEAEQVLSARVGEPERPSEANNEYMATCRYIAPRGEGVVVLTVTVSSREYGKMAFQTAREQPFESRAVPGVGDDAFWIGDPLHTLYVLQGDVLLTFGGDVQLDQIKPLAIKALEQLP